MKVEERIKELGLVLPPVETPTASYLNWRITGNLLYISGQTPRTADGVLQTGRLGENLTVEQGYEHARLSALGMLAYAKEALGDLDRIEKVVKLLGLVASAPTFYDQPKVVNGCSDTLVAVLGKEIGSHARSAVGLVSLPGGSSLEIEVIMQFKA